MRRTALMFALAGMVGALVATPIAVYATHRSMGAVSGNKTFKVRDLVTQSTSCLRAPGGSETTESKGRSNRISWWELPLLPSLQPKISTHS